MQALACILFQVKAGDADALGPGSVGYFDVPILRQRFVVLGNLVSLRQVRIKIILAGEDGGLTHLAIQGLRRQYSKLHCFPVQHRQRSRQSQAHWADIGIGWSAELSGASAEYFGCRQELDMDLQPDHRLIFLANSRRKLSERCHQEIIGQSGLTDSVYQMV